MQKLEQLTNLFPEGKGGTHCLSQCVRNVIFSHVRFEVDWNRVTVHMEGITGCREQKREMSTSEFGMTW